MGQDSITFGSGTDALCRRCWQEQRRLRELEQLCAANLEKQNATKSAAKESFPSRSELADAAAAREEQRKQVRSTFKCSSFLGCRQICFIAVASSGCTPGAF